MAIRITRSTARNLITADAKAKGGSTPPAKPTRAEARKAAQLVRERFARARRADADYGRRLRQIARAVSHLVTGFAHKGIVGAHLDALTAALAKYSILIEPWARAVGARMVADVSQRDAKAWKEHGQAIGRNLEAEIRGADTGALMRRLQAEQVDLITSLPRHAAERVHRLAVEAVTKGRRPKFIAREIMRTGHVVTSRADLIARTEVSRASALLTQARAMSIGSVHFTWVTARDSDVRPEHQRLNGKVFRWDTPPIAGRGKGGAAQRYVAGCGPNCRCSPFPVLDGPIEA